MNKNILITILLIVAVLGGIYWYSQNGNISNNPTSTAPTELVPPALPE